MNPQDFENQADLTAYALGELSAKESSQVRALLAKSPEARAEYERILETVDILQNFPSPPKHSLHPHQRVRVLAGPVQATPKAKVLPFVNPAPARKVFIRRVIKVAAAACLATGAFVLGQKSQRVSPVASTLETSPQETSPSTEAPTLEVVTSAPTFSPAENAMLNNFEAVVMSAPSLQIPEPAIAAAPLPQAVAPVQPAAKPEPAPVIAKVKAPEKAQQVAAAPAINSDPINLDGFSNTLSAPDSSIVFQPKLAQRTPLVFAGIVLSSPVKTKPAATQNVSRKSEPQPPLMIHSWKAEIASCPWDPSRRLMRFVAQIPVDQPGIEFNEADYKLVAKFDPFQVQGYRLVAEKHVPPSQGGMQATRIAWYEIIPSRNFSATSEKPMTIGSLNIVQPKGASNQESVPLKLVDRGQHWNDAREDFVFETAMVGFGLLLKGTENISHLNHNLVLEIAEKTKGEDPKGERAKFIQVIKQAQDAGGL